MYTEDDINLVRSMIGNYDTAIWQYPNSKTRSELAKATKTRIDFLNDLIKNIKSYI